MYIYFCLISFVEAVISFVKLDKQTISVVTVLLKNKVLVLFSVPFITCPTLVDVQIPLCDCKQLDSVLTLSCIMAMSDDDHFLV